jgi:hypothetical protein
MIDWPPFQNFDTTRETARSPWRWLSIILGVFATSTPNENENAARHIMHPHGYLQLLCVESSRSLLRWNFCVRERKRITKNGVELASSLSETMTRSKIHALRWHQKIHYSLRLWKYLMRLWCLLITTFSPFLLRHTSPSICCVSTGPGSPWCRTELNCCCCQ